ncbi:hypothetical protein VNI00_008681 [Paramarasmius palmivorus]|uniref:NACHT domain-containing protein n=1 Tax=Paramarasmius palmivorus TaxID=297713 RepID=A0AAW0CXV2_9AGAR
MSINNPNQVHMRDAINVTEGNQYNYAFNVSSDGNAEALRILAQNAAPNACYDSEQRFPPPNCHEGTRLQVLEKLSNRMEDKSKANNVLWLYGSAGVGKSAIAQHLAEKYAKSGRLGAAFFFSRNDSSRDNIGPLVASIVYQFCQSESPLYTTLAPAIIDVIRSNPNIFRSSCESQVEKLIIQACSNIDTVEQENPPNIIIIDGLDECNDRAEQERVLAIVRALIYHSASYFSWIILLCSRPEHQIRYGFGHKGFERHLETFDVNSLDNVNRDIRRYLVDKFTALRTKYRHALGQGESSWPGEDVIGKLVARADGQFIFAATVVKYLDVDDEPPQDRLDTIMRIYVEQGESPYSPLDMLYHQILSTCRNWNKVQPLLRLLATPHFAHPNEDHSRSNRHNNPNSKPNQWRSFETLALLLDFKVHEVSTLLIRLHSVLQIPEGVNQEQNILFAHATFPEFLADPNRSGKFHTPAMLESKYCDLVATHLLRTSAAFAPSYPLYHSVSFDSAIYPWIQKVEAAGWLIAFSCQWWDYYCTKVVSPSEDLFKELENMDVHVFSAIALKLDLGLPLHWDYVIKWAKVVFRSHVNRHNLTNYNLQGLGTSRVDMLVEKLQMTMMEVHITFATSLDDYQARRWMFERIFSIEERLFGPREYVSDIAQLSDITQPFEDTILEELRTPSHELFNPLATERVWLLPLAVVPRDMVPKVSNILPIVHVTRDNVRIFQRIYEVLKKSDSWLPMTRLLLGYVVDRSLTISDHSGNPVRFPENVLEADLVHFATIFKERLAMSNLDLNRSKGAFWLVDTARHSNPCDIHDDVRFHDSESISTPKVDTEQHAPRSPQDMPDVDDRPKGDHNHRRDHCCFQ